MTGGGRPFPTITDARRALRSHRAAEPRAHRGRHPWIPARFVIGEREWRQLIDAYVAVDDVDDGRAVFSAVPWPTLDARHRLVFGQASIAPFAVRLDVARAFFGANRLAPNTAQLSGDAERQLQFRVLRVGDVFAMSARALDALRTAPTTARDLEVLDITADAREAAKVAFYAAAAQTLDPTRQADRELAETIWVAQDEAGGEGREQ
jgi:hypothetical protein